jgi:hypothetical protein
MEKLSEEAMNCLRHWKRQSMYSHCKTFSDVIVAQMREWCHREHRQDGDTEFKEIINGES